MTIDTATARRIARLSRLAMDEAEIAAMAQKMNGIITFVEQLGEVNTDAVEPLASVADIALALRKDEVTDGGNPQKVLANAPESVEGFFVVPKIVEQEE